MVSSSANLALVLATALAAPAAGALQVSAPVLENYSVVGNPSAGPCYLPRLSVTGRFLTFVCLTNDLVHGDGNDHNDTFLRDRSLRTTERVSVDSLGHEHRFGSGQGFSSIDGTRVVFTSLARLHADLTFPYFSPGVSNAFMRDLGSGTTELVGRTASGGFAPVTGSTLLRGVSFATSTVLFSTADNMLSSDPPPNHRPYQLYVRNWETGSIELITQTPGGDFSLQGTTGAGTISLDGRYVAFMSGATDLGPSNPTNDTQLLIRDRLSRTTRRLSFPAAGGDFTGEPYYQSKAGHFASDARYLAVEASSDELAGGDAPGLPDVYLVDTATTKYELISRGYGGQPPDGASFELDVSGDGRFVAFFSRASNLLATPQAPAVYVGDRLTGELVNVSAPLGAPRFLHIPVVSFSPDGSTVAFDWWHPDSDPQFGGRSLIYTVEVRGGAAPSAMSIPATGRTSLAVLGLMLAFGAWFARNGSTRHRTALF